jgi:cobalt/nickel transport system permease protein
LRHAIVEQWSRGTSPLHRRDPAAKLVPLIVFLIVVATAHRRIVVLAGVMGALLVGAVLAGRLPLPRVLGRAAIVLPFSGIFALLSWASGDISRGLELVLKSYISVLAVLVVMATTPLPGLLRRLELLGVPAFVLTVAQFLYRYLFVVSEEAGYMRRAALARGGMSFRSAGGALAVLFARSYSRAQDIHRAMLARGFNGRYIPLAPSRFTTTDALFAAGGGIVPIIVRLFVGQLA